MLFPYSFAVLVKIANKKTGLCITGKLSSSEVRLTGIHPPDEKGDKICVFDVDSTLNQVEFRKFLQTNEIQAINVLTLREPDPTLYKQTAAE